MRLMYPFETIFLDQFNSPAKTRPHVGRERLQLIPHAVVE